MNRNKKHIAFLLGAGFSVPAGMPTANILNESILASIYNNIRSAFQEGEDLMLESFILEKVLIDYDKCYKSFNYEDYFDCFVQERERNLDTDKLLSFIERGMYGYFWHCSLEKDRDYEIHRNKIIEMQNALIKKCDEYSKFVEGRADWYQNFIAHKLLGPTKNGKCDSFNLSYRGFVNILLYYVNEGYIIDIYTLNHDLLLESLLSHTELKDKVCNGFGGEIGKIKNKEFKTFNPEYFDNTIRIYKLHGSIDIHELSFLNKRDKECIQIVDGYSDMNAYLMDNFVYDSMLPLFLTGKYSKSKQYTKEPYRSMLNELKNNIGDAEKVIVIGYSGNDKGINEIIYQNYSNWSNAIVVSPTANEHPFVQEKQAIPLNKGIELLSSNDLNNI